MKVHLIIFSILIFISISNSGYCDEYISLEDRYKPITEEGKKLQEKLEKIIIEAVFEAKAAMNKRINEEHEKFKEDLEYILDGHKKEIENLEKIFLNKKHSKGFRPGYGDNPTERGEGFIDRGLFRPRIQHPNGPSVAQVTSFFMITKEGIDLINKNVELKTLFDAWDGTSADKVFPKLVKVYCDN